MITDPIKMLSESQFKSVLDKIAAISQDELQGNKGLTLSMLELILFLVGDDVDDLYLAIPNS